MLNRPEDGRNVQKLLALADYLEGDITFDMADWRYCICGNYLKMTGREWVEFAREQVRQTIDPVITIADELGLDRKKALDLFLFRVDGEWGNECLRVRAAELTAAEVAKVIRHLALTGQIDWSFRWEKGSSRYERSDRDSQHVADVSSLWDRLVGNGTRLVPETANSS